MGVINSEKKILFVAEGAHPSKQGEIETFGRTLLKIFTKNLDYLVYEPRKREEHKHDEVIEIKCRGFFKYLNKLSNYKFREYLMKTKIEKINPKIAILNFPRCIKFFRNQKDKKKILVQHTCFNNYMSQKEYFDNNQHLIKSVIQEINYFIFLSKFDKDKFTKKLNIPPEKSRVIRHSCNLPLFNGVKQKNKKLIMIARIENKQKRFDLAIKAMKKLEDFTLEIYGNGKKRNRIYN